MARLYSQPGSYVNIVKYRTCACAPGGAGILSNMKTLLETGEQVVHPHFDPHSRAIMNEWRDVGKRAMQLHADVADMLHVQPSVRQLAAVATADPRQTVVLGSSYGGLAAAFLACRFPALFGVVFPESGWFRWRPTLLDKGYAVRYQEYSGGHDASSLEYSLAQGLRELFRPALDKIDQ